MTYKKIIASLCLITACTLTVHAQESILFHDNMTTLNNWSKGAFVTQDDTTSHAPYLKMGNGITVAKLSQSVTTDWTLTADVRHTNYARGLWLGLFDAKMKQGYVFYWDSSLEKNHKGNGYFTICKIEIADKPLNYKSQIIKLSKNKSGSIKATGPAFTHVKLTWEAATGKITLTVNDKLLQTVLDTSFKTFDKIILKGSTFSLMDNVKLSVKQ